uniref:DUF834 domain-containing protein n=1 Tax=Oryza nivara TaxID=4536 RepID=A0A0E0GKT2_ORYNI
MPGRREVVDDDDAVPAGKQLVDEVAADEARSPRDDDAEGWLADADGEAARGGGGGGDDDGRRATAAAAATTDSGGDGGGERGEGGVDEEAGGGEEEAEEDEEEAVLAEEVGGEGAGEGEAVVVRAVLLAEGRLAVELLHCRWRRRRGAVAGIGGGGGAVARGE